MALVVEDGTGIPDANAYIDATFIADYCLGELLTQWDAMNTDAQDASLISATQYVDVAFDWKGKRKTLEQGLSWPRTGVLFDGFPVNSIPVQIKKAVAETVILIMHDEELFSNEADRVIASEQVDVMKYTYRDNAEHGKNAATKFDVLNRVLRGLYKTESAGGVQSARVLRV